MNSLIAIQGPTQFITAFISLLWYEESIAKKRTDAVLLVYDTGVADDNESLLHDSIKNLALLRNWKDIIFITEVEMREISMNRYSTCISKLHSKLKDHNFDVIFVARDYGSFGTKLILNAYPKALRIEYGDSFGLVGNEKVFNISFREFLKSPVMFSKSFLKMIIYGHFPKKFQFDFTILTMPLDWQGDYLKNKNFIVPDKEFAFDVFSRISGQLTKLSLFCEQLMTNINQNSNLYLLSNLANSGVITHKNELELYEEIIRETAEPGDTLILKNHPRGSNVMLTSLSERLSADYDVRIIDNHEFRFIPIELWHLLIERCNVFPVFSSSVISLKYLFLKRVIMPLDDYKINKYFYKDKIEHIIKVEDLCRVATAALDDWDGKSPLWIGTGK